MYEPIRAKSVHAMAEPEGPHRSREAELDIRLAGHLTALLTVTDELRALTPDEALDEAALQLSDQVAQLSGGRAPQRAKPSASVSGGARIQPLHQRAHTLAGNALVVATSRENEPAAALAAGRLEWHARALGLTASA